jgi:hypothetical protein
VLRPFRTGLKFKQKQFLSKGQLTISLLLFSLLALFPHIKPDPQEQARDDRENYDDYNLQDNRTGVHFKNLNDQWERYKPLLLSSIAKCEHKAIGFLAGL